MHSPRIPTATQTMHRSLSNDYHLVPGEFFSVMQWNGTLRPFVDDLVKKPGGVLLLSVEVDPHSRNYPQVRFGVFDAQERKALRDALVKVKKKRESENSAIRLSKSNGDSGIRNNSELTK